MTSLRCGARCGRPAKGGVICPPCGKLIVADLGKVASLREALQDALARQTAMGRGVGGRSCETPMPYGEEAGNALRALEQAVERIYAAQAPAVELRCHPQAATLLEHLHDAVEKGLDIVDRPADRWYAGACGYAGDEDEPRPPCKAELYVEVGEAYVRCPACGEMWDVQSRRRHLLDVVRERLAHAALLEVALDQLEVRLTAATVRQWARRGHITRVDFDEKGRPRYRVGEVLDRIAEEERRVTEAMSDAPVPKPCLTSPSVTVTL